MIQILDRRFGAEVQSRGADIRQTFSRETHDPGFITSKRCHYAVSYYINIKWMKKEVQREPFLPS